MNPQDTLSGTYTTAEVVFPDGRKVPVLVRMVKKGDGSMGMVVVDDAMMEFEQRFANTRTVPNDQVPVDTEVLTKNQDTSSESQSETSSEKKEPTTDDYVNADLCKFIGDPDRIIAQKGLDPERLAHMKEHKASLTMARRLCTLAGPKWQEVLQYLPEFFPDSRPDHKG